MPAPRREFAVGVPSAEFEHFSAPETAGRQRQQNWCWAACMQMVLNYHGERVTQEEAVKHVFGAQVDQPGRPEQIVAALRDWRSERHTVNATLTANPLDVLNDLEQQRPLIAGVQAPVPGAAGHGYVLTGAMGHWEQNTPVIDRVVLRDPYPGTPSRLEMGADEFRNRCMFMVRVGVG